MSIRRFLPPSLLQHHNRTPMMGERGTWYAIRNQADERAIVDLYDEIGEWGIPASQFVRDLRTIDAKTIELHINSPGGMIYDGLAIYNALMDHPARVEAIVDGAAFSAASWIFQAGELRSMNRHTELFIHDGLALTIGNEEDHLASAADLGRLSNTIAGIYAGRAGGTVDEWRTAMRAETTYSAQDAVDAGLADEVLGTEDGGEQSNILPRAQLVTARARAHSGKAA